MVEQVTINPEEVRGYGNICEGHTLEDFIISNSGLAKEKETVHGALTDVYRLVYSLYGLMFNFDKGNKQLYLQMAEADILSFGFDTVNKQLYLVDENDTGFNLGFDTDTNELYITDDAPPIVHNYSLAFSAASYVATGGSAILECTLLDNNVPVQGATVTVTGSDSSVYTGITNSQGLAEINVSSITGTVTFTASYSNVTDTCTVTSVSYLFYDACDSSSGLSNYGTLHKLRVQNVDGTLSYDSGMNAYKITTTTANADGFCDFPIPALDNKDGFYLECEIYTTDTTTGGQPGLVVYPASSTGGEGVFYRDIASINRCGVLKFANWAENGESGNSQKSNLPVANNWIKLRIEVNGTSVKGIWLKTDDTEIYTHTYTVPYTSSQMRVGICALLKSTTKLYYVRNVKAESL